MNVISGKVLSARSYSLGSSIYPYKWRSMQITSGSQPMAYVFSYIQTTNLKSILCKFNPISFTSTPLWIKEVVFSSLWD